MAQTATAPKILAERLAWCIPQYLSTTRRGSVAALDEQRNVSLGSHTRKASCLVFPKFRARPAYLPNFLIPPTPIAPWMTLTTIFLNI